MIKGMDISTLLEVEANGGKFYDGGEAEDLFVILKRYGVTDVRLRLWNDPYAEDGTPYGAGTNDLDKTILLSKRAKAAGMGILLDFHYSDFWADPGKQIMPKAWRGLDNDALEKKVYEYTAEVLQTLIRENVAPTMVQVGNELSNGTMWPNAKVPEYKTLQRFINAGIRAVHEYLPGVPVMLHLDNGGKNELYREWFDHFVDGGEDFDIIGLSFYPFWHGTLESLKNNVNDISVRYNKKIALAEVSMGFTMEDYAAYEKLGPDERKGYATKPELVASLKYPMTKQGQSDFMQEIMEIIAQVPEEKGLGFFYWEPAWIPVPNVGWANEAALAYTGEKGPGGNEWANQALFDYDGNVLPALARIRDYE